MEDKKNKRNRRGRGETQRKRRVLLSFSAVYFLLNLLIVETKREND
jgi:hypothetical protein